MRRMAESVKGILDEPETFFERLKSGGRLHFLAVATGAFFSLGAGFVLAELAFPFVRTTASLVTVGVVLAVAVFLANASVWWIACKAVGGKAGWAHFVNAWGYSLLPVAAVAVPLAIVMLVVGNGFLRVLTTPIAAVGGVVLLLLVVAALLTLSLRYAVFERVMGLSWWRIAAGVVVFGVVMSVPWGLYSGYATITHSTSDLAFFEPMKPTLFDTYPSPGAKHTFTIREADNLFLRTPYMRGNPQRGDVVLYVPESDLGAEHAAMRFPGLARLAVRGVTSVMTSGPRFSAKMGRVVACPGETVALRDGVVYVDGAHEAFPVLASSGSGASLDATLLGEDEFFVIGDNRSADTGMVVKKEQILGRYPRLRLALHRASIPTVLRLGHDED